MRIGKIHRLYVQELKSLHGWKMQSPTPTELQPDRSADADDDQTQQQARQLDRIFKWLGQPPVFPQLGTHRR